ncbi:Aste57867_12152 [Aphanomyces stellatus]|uniref:Aste57867_12152 protein n=1 Tax=Aphanomyces stellatus TaxID=120398 RepID=A0A485KUS4_9STRA|nr:hypothetical protein As57867_012107 [Aphanomyces stellatus]VFT89006.1 Aste57867_12152 [Aphanomyces stellatus]
MEAAVRAMDATLQRVCRRLESLEERVDTIPQMDATLNRVCRRLESLEAQVDAIPQKVPREFDVGQDARHDAGAQRSTSRSRDGNAHGVYVVNEGTFVRDDGSCARGHFPTHGRGTSEATLAAVAIHAFAALPSVNALTQFKVESTATAALCNLSAEPPTAPAVSPIAAAAATANKKTSQAKTSSPTVVPSKSKALGVDAYDVCQRVGFKAMTFEEVATMTPDVVWKASVRPHGDDGESPWTT